MTKRRAGSQIDNLTTRPLKAENCCNFLACRWCVTYRSKGLNDRYNFASNFILIRGLHAKLWAPKIAGVSVVGILGLPLGSPRINWHLVLVPWPSTKHTIRGKVVVSPKSKPWWILWIRVCPWFVHAPKCSNYALTNLLFGLCRSVWVIELLVNLLSPILKLQHALLPPKCYELGSVP
jgi:hypothetical protein